MKPKHFKLAELVDPRFLDLKTFTPGSENVWRLLDTRLMILLDDLRDRYGPLTINNWAGGGNFKESGLRWWETSTGATWSDHKFGRAADIRSAYVAAEEILEDIKTAKYTHPLLSVVESDTPTWVHVGVANHNSGGILWVPFR